MHIPLSRRKPGARAQGPGPRAQGPAKSAGDRSLGPWAKHFLLGAGPWARAPGFLVDKAGTLGCLS